MSKIEEARNVKADGNRYFKAGDYTTAIERYETGLSLAEDDLELRYALLGNLTLAYYQLKHYAKALDFSNETIKVLPSELKGYERKIQILLAQNEYLTAWKAYEEAKQNCKTTESLAKLKKKIHTSERLSKQRKKGFLTSYSELYGEYPAVGASESQRRSIKVKRMLEKIKTLLAAPKKDSALVDGLFEKLMDPENFRMIVYKCKEIPDNSIFPRSFQEMLEDEMYLLGLEQLFPMVQQRANKVLANVKEQGAKEGDYMDEVTEKRLKPQILYEAFAHEVVEMIHNVSRIQGASIAQEKSLIASFEDERALLDQLGRDCIMGLLDNSKGFGVHDGFLEDSDCVLQNALRNDVFRMDRAGLLHDLTEGRKEITEAWIREEIAERSYPAIHYLMQQLSSLPFELNKKLKEEGIKLDLIGMSQNARILVIGESSKDSKKEAKTYTPTLDGTRGESGNGLCISAVYSCNLGWNIDDGGDIVLRPKENDPIKFEPMYDRLILYRSRQVENWVMPWNSSSPRISLHMYFNGPEQELW